MRRVISLWLPRFATDRLRRRLAVDPHPDPLPQGGRGRGPSRQRWEGEGPPLVTALLGAGRCVVAAVDAQASAAGIAPGMPLADARALAPGGLAVHPVDAAGDAAALERLAEWCGRYTPWTSVESAEEGGGAGLWLDVTGCAHLFGGEAAMLADLVHGLARLGFATRAGLADTPGAAWAAARFLSEAALTATVAPGEARAALAPLPVAALRLPAAEREGLGRLGLRRVGDLYPLARAPLARRFGPLPGLRLDQALGRVEEPISPRRPVAPHRAALGFPEPIAHREAIAAALRRLLGAICRGLEAAGAGARALELVLYRVDGTVQRARIGTSRPNREPAALERLFVEHLDRLDPGFGIEAMSLAAPIAEPLTALQLALTPSPTLPRAAGEGSVGARACSGRQESDLHAEGAETGISASPRAPNKDRSADEWERLAPLFDALGNRLGFARLQRLGPRESHLPERAVRAHPVWSTPPRAPWPAATRPLRLLARPEPIEAETLCEDGPPCAFRRGGGRLHHVTRAEGPERIAAEWWRATTPAAPDGPERDYWRIEDESGRRFWLFREAAASAASRWFLHGLFA